MPGDANTPVDPALPSVKKKRTRGQLPALREEPPEPSPRVKAAVEVFRAGAGGQLSRAEVESVVAKTRRGIRATAPLAAEAVIEILSDESVSAGTRLKAAMFALQGGGVTQPGAPVTEAERRANDADMEDLKEANVEDLSRSIHMDAGLSPVPPIGKP